MRVTWICSTTRFRPESGGRTIEIPPTQERPPPSLTVGAQVIRVVILR